MSQTNDAVKWVKDNFAGKGGKQVLAVYGLSQEVENAIGNVTIKRWEGLDLTGKAYDGHVTKGGITGLDHKFFAKHGINISQGQMEEVIQALHGSMSNEDYVAFAKVVAAEDYYKSKNYSTLNPAVAPYVIDMSFHRGDAATLWALHNAAMEINGTKTWKIGDVEKTVYELTPNPVAGLDNPKYTGKGTQEDYLTWKAYYRRGLTDSNMVNEINKAFGTSPESQQAFVNKFLDNRNTHYSKDIAYDAVVRKETGGKGRTEDGIVFGNEDINREKFRKGWVNRTEAFRNIAVSGGVEMPVITNDNLPNKPQSSFMSTPEDKKAMQIAAQAAEKAPTQNAGEPEEDYKKRKADEIIGFLKQMNLGDLEMMLVMVFLVLGGVISKEDVDSYYSEEHNKNRNDPNYDGRYAKSQDGYQRNVSRVSGGETYPDAGKSYEAYSHGKPVEVPADQMLKNFAINGGVQIVRDGKFIHNANNIFARYAIEVCDKAKKGREGIPDDAPGVTLSIPHYYKNGTLGAKLPDGLWEHERGTFKMDIKREMLAKAGFKVFALQENVMGQLENIAANGNNSSVLDHPIATKAAQCDANFEACKGQHIAFEDHFNHVDSSAAKGFEVIVDTDAGADEKSLANRITGENKRHTETALRGRPIISGEYGLPNRSKSAVVLTEAGFASNPDDAKRLASPDACYKESYADVMATIKHGLSKGWKLNDCEMTRTAIKEMVENEKADEQALVKCLRPKADESKKQASVTPAPSPEMEKALGQYVLAKSENKPVEAFSPAALEKMTKEAMTLKA